MRLTSAMAVCETYLAVARKQHLEVSAASLAGEEYLAIAQIEVIDLAAETRFAAPDAFARFGKGRHPAALNFGDCFAYACARQANVPLLYKGDVFALTDVAAA